MSVQKIFLAAALSFRIASADLPVREVILYKHGVGYFERGGALKPGEAAKLDFKASEMNDVLKSLTIAERSGARITGLRYDSSEPLERKLAGFPFRLGDQQPLSALFDQLKGARLELRVGTDTVTGVIAGARLVASDGKNPQREMVSMFLDSGELRMVDLSAATSIRFPDPKLQAQFREYLTAFAGSRSEEKRSLYIDYAQGAARDVIASYMVPTAIWKSSYRLIFGSEPQPMLEGWAIVDNTTGEDWSNVKLALVSGRPISFISQLYEPRYRQRPVADLPDLLAAGPQLHDGAIRREANEARGAVAGMLDSVRARTAPAQIAAAADMAFVERDKLESTITAAASGRELGELFEYRFGEPVTVHSNESAMLPFLQQRIDARKLLIYSDPASQHPSNAIEITNSSGKTLDGGPVTVYDNSAYAGEALMETLKNGDKRLISYAVDLGTRVTTNLESSSDIVREVRFRRGVLIEKLAAQEIKTYSTRNVDAKPKTLIVEHPVRPGFKLVSPAALETTARHYRFEVKLAAGAASKFAVQEERVYDQRYSVTNLTPDVLATYVRNRTLSDAARKQLEAIVGLKRQIAGADGDLQQGQRTMEELVRDQDRIRQNLGSLNRVSGQQEQVQKYSRQLADQEIQLAALRDAQAEARKRKSGLEAEMNAAIEKLEF